MDAGIIDAAYFFSWYLRFKSGVFVQDAGVLPAKTYFSALFLIIPGYLLLYSIFQLYMPRIKSSNIFLPIKYLMKSSVSGIPKNLSKN